jgi:hypothetical protein
MKIIKSFEYRGSKIEILQIDESFSAARIDGIAVAKSETIDIPGMIEFSLDDVDECLRFESGDFETEEEVKQISLLRGKILKEQL